MGNGKVIGLLNQLIKDRDRAIVEAGDMAYMDQEPVLTYVSMEHEISMEHEKIQS